MKVLYHTRPYELSAGESNRTYEQLNWECRTFLMKKYPSWSEFRKLCQRIVERFDQIRVSGEAKPRVGIVGEILVKFSPSANNELVELLEAEGAEAVVPDLMDFLLYCFKNTEFRAQYLGKKKRPPETDALGSKHCSFSGALQTGRLSGASTSRLLPTSTIWRRWRRRSSPSEIRPEKDGS